MFLQQSHHNGDILISIDLRLSIGGWNIHELHQLPFETVSDVPFDVIPLGWLESLVSV